jgi:glycosyltransferase involved in cell wall biosynthesis
VTVAIVHDYLSQTGGAERVVLQLAATFDDAPIYTSFYAPDRTYPEFQSLDVRPSPMLENIDPDRFRKRVLQFPQVFANMKLDTFDAVIVSSSAFAHHVRHENSIVYCHTPPRYLYHPSSYASGRLSAAALRTVFAWQRPADKRAARRHLEYVANSDRTRLRIRRYYQMEAEVIHPPLWLDHLPDDLTALPSEPRVLVVSRLLPYKRIDIAVEACRHAGVGLTVVGDGPERERLEGLETDATFLGRVTDDELRQLFIDHSIVLVSGAEDFGYLPVEANYAGRPVVALAEGGNLESVIDGETGVLVDSDDPKLWANALATALAHAWDPVALRRHAMRYHPETFAARLRSLLETAR